MYTPALPFLREVRWALDRSDAAVEAAAERARARVAGLRASVRPDQAGALSALRKHLLEKAMAQRAAAAGPVQEGNRQGKQ
jgi:hypothetical protein